MAVDHYHTLGVIPGTSAADLRAAYLKLARSNHPDKFDGADRDKAQHRMQQINEAWNVLGVAHKRREYDAANRTDQRVAGNGERSHSARGHANFRPFDDEPLSHKDVDFDTTPIAGSRNIPRWATFLPVGLFVFGVVVLAFGTMVNATGIFVIGIMSLAFGVVCFLMLPLVVMSRADRDPDL